MVAGKRLSPQDTARIRAYLNDTAHPRTGTEIANLIGVSTRTIERLRLNFDLFDAPYPPPSARLGRPPTLNAAQQAWVLEFFNERPYAHLADATAAIWERFDVNVSLKSVANLLYKNRWNRQGKRGSNKTTLQAPPDVARDGAEGSTRLREETPEVARDVAESSTRLQDETPDVAPVLEGPQVQPEDAWDFVPQPVASPSPELTSPPSPVVLPEISLPAFYLQSAVEPTTAHDRRVMPLLSVRQPCPTCGCSSRKHQNA